MENKFENCERKFLSKCCNAHIIMGDICSSCQNVCENQCADCNEKCHCPDCKEDPNAKEKERIVVEFTVNVYKYDKAIRSIKTWTKWASGLAIGAVSFWLLETIFFIVMYGWHWKAYNTAELICDKIVSYTLNAATICFYVVLIEIILLFYNNRIKLK